MQGTMWSSTKRKWVALLWACNMLLAAGSQAHIPTDLLYKRGRSPNLFHAMQSQRRAARDGQVSRGLVRDLLEGAVDVKNKELPAAVAMNQTWGPRFRRKVVNYAGHGVTFMEFDGNVTDHAVVNLDFAFVGAVTFERVQCNWTTITVRSPHIIAETFDREPFLVAPSSWRCRPGKRGGSPLYRRVVGLPHRVDNHTVVLTTRKASVMELVTGKIVVQHGTPTPRVPYLPRHVHGERWRRGMWDMTLNIGGHDRSRAL
jgi:hypothetical protein